MKKILALVLFGTMFALVGCSKQESNTTPKSVETEEKPVVEKLNVEYKEGVHYRVVENINVGDLKAPFLVEYFWLGCPHCQHFEAPLQKFKSENPAVGFLRKHAVLSQNWVNDARIYYALKETDNMAHFAELFDLYKKGMNEEKFNAFFEKNNIDQDAFLETAGKNENILAQMKESFDEMSKNNMTGVPGIVVNGKYLIIATKDTATNESYFDLVKYLLKK